MAGNSLSVTQKDIARRVGVTQQSVALALKGHHSVSTDMRSRIELAAKELGYDRLGNSGARALIARRYGKHIKTGIIAVALTPEIGPMRGVPFFLSILEGIEDYASGLGLDIYLWYQVNGRSIPRLLREEGVDGVICLGGDALNALAGSRLPTVSFLSAPGNLMSIDDKECTRLAVHHLAELGHASIGYLGWDHSIASGIERHEGFRQGMAECGLSVRESLVDTSLFHFQSLPENVSHFIARAGRFTALVCYNDMVAMDAVRTMERMGMRVPHDVSVVGIDDVSVESHFQPSLTSISYDRVAMGSRAAQIINEFADQLVTDGHSEPKPPFIREKFPVCLVQRDSTCQVK